MTKKIIDKRHSVKETLQDFTKFCEDEKATGVICIAIKNGNDEDDELISSFSSHLKFSEKMGMLEETKVKFNHDY